jgi:hypothetical protein
LRRIVRKSEIVTPHIPDATRVACSTCRQPLKIHQPDLTRPDRLLATCSRCGAWFLLKVGDHGEMIMTRLPAHPGPRRLASRKARQRARPTSPSP